MLVREEWKQIGSTRESLPHEVMIYKVVVSKMIGDISKAVRDERNRRTMREFLYQKVRMKITTFDLVDWEAVDKIIDKSNQQFRLWVTKHVRKFCGTKKYYIDGELQQMQYAPAA